MKSLSLGEEVLAIFPTGSKFGTCTMYMTNFGIAIETNRSGLILSLNHSEILSYLQIGKHSTRLTWEEGKSFSELILQCDTPELICAKYRQIRDDHVNLLKKIGFEPDGPTEDITVKSPLMERKRFEKIPKYVEDSETWNDCWFDRTKNIYVTHNSFFKSWHDLHARPHQIEYRIESTDDGMVILGEKVSFRLGFPAVKLPASKGNVWFLLPTINSVESTWKIEAARFTKDPEQRIDFTIQ